MFTSKNDKNNKNYFRGKTCHEHLQIFSSKDQFNMEFFSKSHEFYS